jgi:protein-L-isoaspartate(D-aspartate) O-methyltransferase
MGLSQSNFTGTSSGSAAAERFAAQVVNQAEIFNEEIAVRIYNALKIVPRELFVPEQYVSRAYDDVTMPLAPGRMMPKPSVVARMLGLIEIRPKMRILEVGCGNGYCSALMAAGGAVVFATERNGALAQKTRKLLDAISLSNIIVRRAIASRGWPEHAPFDAVIVSSPIPAVERALLSQLVAGGGRLVAPVGGSSRQTLTLWERQPANAPLGKEFAAIRYEEDCFVSEGEGAE